MAGFDEPLIQAFENRAVWCREFAQQEGHAVRRRFTGQKGDDTACQPSQARLRLWRGQGGEKIWKRPRDLLDPARHLICAGKAQALLAAKW